MMLTPLITHGFTPGRFDPDRCQVQLTRYPCPWPREAHDPRLPPVDIDCFGRRRREAGESVTPEPRTEVTTVEERDALPAGVVVRSAGGTIACRHHSGMGVAFGDERLFSWSALALPLTVLWAPGAEAGER